jgi:hypothetical protein
VFFEGMAISNEVTRSANLPGLVIIALTTPIEVCAASALGRRGPRMKHHAHADKVLDNCQRRARELERAYVRLEDKGVQVERLDREQAWLRICKLLGVDLDRHTNMQTVRGRVST